MKIERRFTKAGQSAYAEIEFRKATSEIKNPDGSVVFRLADIDVPAQFSQVAADILAQKYFRKAGVPAKLKRVEENDVPSFLWRSVPDNDALKALPKEEQYGSKPMPARFSIAWPAPGPIGAGRAAISTRKRTPAPSATSSPTCSPPSALLELAAMVQHRPPLGLWHRRPRPGPFLRRSLHRQADEVEVRLRTPAAARLLHSVGRGRPRQRGRHHGSLGA